MDTDKLSVFVCVQCFVHLRFQIAYYQVFLTLPSRHAWGFLLHASGLDTQMQALKYPRSVYVDKRTRTVRPRLKGFIQIFLFLIPTTRARS
jgi:hypothetical protein